MAKRIDINSFHKRFERDETKKPRSVGTRNLRVYFLIVCEGQKTEPHYFSSFNSVLPPYTLDIETQGEGCDPLGVVDAAIELRRTSSKPLNSVWAVFDKDDFPPSRFRQAIEKADKHGIKCAWSNEAFELWYVLHFHYRNTPMSRTEYQKCIEKEMNQKMFERDGKKGKFSYRKNAKDMHDLLLKYGDEAQAIKWGKKLSESFNNTEYAKHNPCTMVFRLVDELNNPGKVLEL